jgi:hydrogenase maturation factor
MCIDFVGRVTGRTGDSAEVDLEGRRLRAATFLVPDIAVGDWVYVAAGTIIERLEPGAAESTNRLLRNAQGALT